MLKILVLVLASDDQPIYVKLQSIWRKYMKSNPAVTCYFYKGDPMLETEYKLDGDTLWIRIEDSLSTVYEKTLKAFEYFANTLNDYDFVFRPNLSSFVAFDKYVQACESFPKRRFVSALVGRKDGYTFPSGSGFTMTPDVILELIKDRPSEVEVDDVTIGYWLHQKGIPIQPASRCDYTNGSIIPSCRNGNMENIFHYRIKNANRELDIVIHKHLIFKIYGYHV